MVIMSICAGEIVIGLERVFFYPLFLPQSMPALKRVWYFVSSPLAWRPAGHFATVDTMNLLNRFPVLHPCAASSDIGIS